MYAVSKENLGSIGKIPVIYGSVKDDHVTKTADTLVMDLGLPGVQVVNDHRVVIVERFF